MFPLPSLSQKGKCQTILQKKDLLFGGLRSESDGKLPLSFLRGQSADTSVYQSKTRNFIASCGSPPLAIPTTLSFCFVSFFSFGVLIQSQMSLG